MSLATAVPGTRVTSAGEIPGGNSSPAVYASFQLLLLLLMMMMIMMMHSYVSEVLLTT